MENTARRKKYKTPITYVVDHVHPHCPAFSAILGIRRRHGSGNLLDDNSDKILLRFSADENPVLIDVDEDYIDIKRGQATGDVQLSDILGDSDTLVFGEGLRVGKDAPERHVGDTGIGGERG
jgi:hypothetical protein